MSFHNLLQRQQEKRQLERHGKVSSSSRSSRRGGRGSPSFLMMVQLLCCCCCLISSMMGRRSPHGVSATAAAAAATSEIVVLTDANFEHETQASTGMTTGSWFIFFQADACPHCLKVKPEFESFRTDHEEWLAEQGIVLATMNVPMNRKTATRFDITGFPVLLYLHQHKVYAFPRGTKRTKEHFYTFLSEQVPAMSGTIIPPPMNAFQVFMKEMETIIQEVQKHGGVIGMAVTTLSFLFFGLLIALMAMCFWPSSSSKKEQKSKHE